MAQENKRPIEELIDSDDPGWPIIAEWVAAAKNRVEVLPADPVKAATALFDVQISTRSPMGAIVHETGGISVDDGWIRILGSGSAEINRSLPGWNADVAASGFLLIADDVVGGFFMLNGGALGEDLGKVYYFAPDNLVFEPLDLTYSDFLDFCFNSDLDRFYEGYRWKNWRKEVPSIGRDMAINFYPPLWTKEGKHINKNSRKAVPIKEQYQYNMDTRAQLNIE